MTQGSEMGASAQGRIDAGLVVAAAAILWILGPLVAFQHGQGAIAVAYLGGLGIASVAIRRGAAIPFLLAVFGAALTLAMSLGGAAGFHPLFITAALLMAYPLVARGSAEPLASASAVAGRLLFAALLLAASFGGVADRLRFATPPPGVFFVAVAPIAVVLTYCLLRGVRRAEVDPLVRGEALLATATIPALLAGLSLDSAFGAIVVTNLALMFLAIGRLTRGSSRGDRASLRVGLALAAALVVARLAEVVLSRS